MPIISNALVPQGNLKANTKSENQDLVNATLDKYKKPVFPPLPDLALRRQAQSHLRKELEKGFEFRLKKLSLELDTALHQVREESNHTLVTGKTRLRKERMEFFANSYLEVAEQFNELSSRFLHNLDTRFQKLEKFSSPVIREREEKRLTKSVDDFLTTLDQLVDEYREIIAEHVDV